LEDFGMGTSGDINIYRITLRWNGMVTLDIYIKFSKKGLKTYKMSWRKNGERTH